MLVKIIMTKLWIHAIILLWYMKAALQSQVNALIQYKLHARSLQADAVIILWINNPPSDSSAQLAASYQEATSRRVSVDIFYLGAIAFNV